ncbi:DeoR/GlpR family DNA-binding transcription regulator [Celerinatantimonas yamalensis]|uniref:HTH deoR-type domain-containing protein n=1 Tax=Celerinatantimonas yamalensis TaxID=559956 RepID=A0ABW9GB26_9GAMM
MRQQTWLLRIQAPLHQHCQPSNASLLEALEVSRETIHRDVMTICAHRLTQRVYTGVIALEYPKELFLTIRQSAPTQERAKGYMRLIQSGQTLFIDAGSSNCWAEQPKTLSDLTTITNNLSVAITLKHSYTSALHRALLLHAAMQARANASSNYHPWGSGIVVAMFSQSKRTIILANHSTIGMTNHFIYTPRSQLDTVVTDHHPKTKITCFNLK